MNKIKNFSQNMSYPGKNDIVGHKYYQNATKVMYMYNKIKYK